MKPPTTGSTTPRTGAAWPSEPAPSEQGPAEKPAGRSVADAPVVDEVQSGPSPRNRTARLLSETGAALPAQSFSDKGPRDPAASSVAARLRALGLAPAAKREALGGVPHSGASFEGNIRIETAADMEKLRGVTHVKGDVAICETAAGRALPWDALSSLLGVDGRFTVEGVAGVAALDALRNLVRIGGTAYFGFNSDLVRASLPSLVSVGGALIFEVNDRLEAISLPALDSVGKYFHVEEHANLVSVEAPRLKQIGGDLMLKSNRRLTGVHVGAPVRLAGALELEENGSERVKGLQIA